MQQIEHQLKVRWADCDPNRHVRHSAYYDYGACCRITFFDQIGFGNDRFQQIDLGPILFKEECSFIRELKLNETISINLLKGKVSPDGRKWLLHHEIYNAEGTKSAHITIQGAWLDLSTRKLVVPPADLADFLHQLPQGEAYSYQKKSQ